MDSTGEGGVVYIEEVLALVLGTGVLLLAVAARARLRELPRVRLLAASFLALYLGWVTTVLESLLLPDLLNLVEHLANATSALLLAAWCWSGRARAVREHR